jgi:hypothetical protein
MRSHRKLIRVVTLAAALSFTAACDDLTSLNNNPNAPDDVSPEFLLPNAIRAGVELTHGGAAMLSHWAIWPQHVVELQYPDEETGLVRPDRMDAYWNHMYSVPLADVQVVVQKGNETNTPNQEAVGLIWRAWLFHQVTDLWGDVPFRDALQGRGNTTPKYDAQRDIYFGLLEDLTKAAGMLTPSGGSFGSGDVLYNNDVERWRRFANSLRMRLAMRLVNDEAARAREEFVAAYNAGGFQGQADNAVLRWPGPPYENPVYENRRTEGRDDHGISGALVDTLKSLNDPRLDLYAEPAALDGAFRGWYNGHARTAEALNHYSRIGTFWRGPTAGGTPSVIMSYAELLFLQAEAAQRGWIGASAAELYHDGIRASMNLYDSYGNPAGSPTDAEIEAYLAQPGVAYNAATGLRQIHLQTWIALYLHGTEAWSHWRRTGVPNLTKGPDMGTSRIPVRLPYPGGEQSFNRANLEEAVARQNGGRDLITPMWWMQQ